MVVGTLVQVLSHGLQLGGGAGAIACSAAVKFQVSPLYTHGESIYMFNFQTAFYLMAMYARNFVTSASMKNPKKASKK